MRQGQPHRGERNRNGEVRRRLQYRSNGNYSNSYAKIIYSELFENDDRPDRGAPFGYENVAIDYEICSPIVIAAHQDFRISTFSSRNCFTAMMGTSRR